MRTAFQFAGNMLAGRVLIGAVLIGHDEQHIRALVTLANQAGSSSTIKPPVGKQGVLGLTGSAGPDDPIRMILRYVICLL